MSSGHRNNRCRQAVRAANGGSRIFRVYSPGRCHTVAQFFQRAGMGVASHAAVLVSRASERDCELVAGEHSRPTGDASVATASFLTLHFCSCSFPNPETASNSKPFLNVIFADTCCLQQVT